MLHSFRVIRANERLCQYQLSKELGRAEYCGQVTDNVMFCDDHKNMFDEQAQKIRRFVQETKTKTKVFKVGKDLSIQIVEDPDQKIPRFGKSNYIGEIQPCIDQSIQLIILFGALETQYKNSKKNPPIPFSSRELNDFGRGHENGWKEALKLVLNQLHLHGFDPDQPWAEAAMYFHTRTLRQGWINLLSLDQHPNNPKNTQG